MRTTGLIGLLTIAACAATTEPNDSAETARQEMSPTDRLFVGAADPYPADLTLRERLPALKASQAARREAAWKIVQRVLEPVRITPAPGAKHDRPGLLCMANRGPNTNGAQFFIQDAPAPHLDSSYTIFGDCTPVDIVHDIASTPTGQSDRPLTPVVIESVKIRRSG